MTSPIFKSTTNTPVSSILRTTESPTQKLTRAIDKLKEKIKFTEEEKTVYIRTLHGANRPNKKIKAQKQTLEAFEKKRLNIQRPSPTFHNAISVILIPCLEEYRKANLTKVMFYNEADENSFREEFKEEVDSFIKLYKIKTGKTLPVKVAKKHILTQETN